MRAERTEEVNGNKIEEFYWAGRVVVYVNHRKFEGTFEEAVEKYLKKVN